MKTTTDFVFTIVLVIAIAVLFDFLVRHWKARRISDKPTETNLKQREFNNKRQ
jgi:hypothetical protein